MITSTKPQLPQQDHSLDTDAVAMHSALSELVRIYQFRDRDRICCHDISVTQCYALEVLVERGPQRSQTLSSALRLDKSTTTRVVDALVRKGYVERTPDLVDRRAVNLSASNSGKRLYKRINLDLVEQQRALLADLDPTIRAGAIEVIRRMGASAAARFTGDSTTGNGMSSACVPESACGSGCD